MKTIIIPVYNESAVIKTVIVGLKDILDSDDEILVIDDGSTDGTAATAEEAGAVVISHPYNIGNGAAIKTGIRNARGAVIVTMDGDGQHDPGDIPHLLKYLGKYDMVVGARGGEGSVHRNLANRFFNLLASYVTGFKVRDLTSGLRVIHSDVAKKFVYLFPNGFSYPTTITLALLKSGHSIKYLPITAKERVGKSKIRPMRDGLKFLSIILKISTLFSPFKIFLPVSGLFFLGGLIYYWYAYITGTRFPNLPVFMIISGVIVFMMGLIAEQIAQMRLDRTETE